MMTFDYAFRFVVLAAMMLVVHTEVHALMKAILYGFKFKKGTLMQRITITVLRYQWASFIWHEIYCDGLDIKASYSVMRPGCVTLAILFVCGGLDAYGIANMPAQVYVPGAFVAGFGYFVSAYGKAFLRYRADVSIGGTQETWKFA